MFQCSKKISIFVIFSLLIVVGTPSYILPGSASEQDEDQVDGIDVSAWQSFIDWSEVYNDSISFCFAKATEGVGWTDSYFETNMNQGSNAGIYMGAYHFATPTADDAVDEAEYFVSIAGEYISEGNLKPVLDLEQGAELGSSVLSEWVHDWMETVENQTGVQPIIYVNSNYANNYLDTSVNCYDLWIAHWTYNPNMNPDTGIWDDWMFWQYSNQGSVSGISGDVDLDVFNGNLNELSSYVIGNNLVYVDDDAESTWYDHTHVRTIQEGINNASNGDTVFVYNGLYPENIIVNKTIDLSGEEKENTVIFGENVSYEPDQLFEEGFEHGFPAENWTNDGWQDSLYGQAHNGSHWAYSWSDGDVLTMPEVQILYSPELSFWTCAENSAHPEDLEVYCNGDLVFADYGFTHTSYEKQTVDLSAYEDTIVVIEFIGLTQSYYGQCLDDIQLKSHLLATSWQRVVKINADFVNMSGFTITNGFDASIQTLGVYIESNHTTILDNNINDHAYGIELQDSSNILIENNVIENNMYHGIYLWTPSGSIENTIIQDNTLDNLGYDIWLYGIQSDTAIIKNNIQSDILLEYSSYINVESNIFSNSGLSLGFSNNNIIQGNTIINSNQGINLASSCENNLIYHNNLINNNESAFDNGINTWYNSTLQEGNYWSDYTGNDANGDGIGDDAYNVSGGNNQDVYPLMKPYRWKEDINQSVFDRGFPVRHAVDGDWAGGQSFIPTTNVISKCILYLRSFGIPEFDLTVELRENNPKGPLINTVTIESLEVPSSWSWVNIDFTDTIIDAGMNYFIVIPPAPSGVINSFGYEWGYAFSNQYDNGSFWFTRDGGSLWRDLPMMYEFSFKICGYE